MYIDDVSWNRHLPRLCPVWAAGAVTCVERRRRGSHVRARSRLSAAVSLYDSTHSVAMARPKQSPRHVAQYDLPPRGPGTPPVLTILLVNGTRAEPLAHPDVH